MEIRNCESCPCNKDVDSNSLVREASILVSEKKLASWPHISRIRTDKAPILSCQRRLQAWHNPHILSRQPTPVCPLHRTLYSNHTYEAYVYRPLCRSLALITCNTLHGMWSCAVAAWQTNCSVYKTIGPFTLFTHISKIFAWYLKLRVQKDKYK